MQDPDRADTVATGYTEGLSLSTDGDENRQHGFSMLRRRGGRQEDSSFGSSDYGDQAVRYNTTRFSVNSSSESRGITTVGEPTPEVPEAREEDPEVPNEDDGIEQDENDGPDELKSESVGPGASHPSTIPSNQSTAEDPTVYSWEFTIASKTHNASHKSGVRGSFSQLHRLSSSPSNIRRGSQRSSRSSKLLDDLTVNKIRFDNRLYGRNNECQTLQAAWEEIRHATKQPANDPSKDNNSNEEGEEVKQRAPTSPQSNHNSASVARRFVTLSGVSGTGKSALAESLRTSVQRAGGFFLQGKFPQQHRLSQDSVEPYAAFAAACRELCELVVSLYTPQAGIAADDEESSNSRKYLKFTLDEFRDKLNQEIGVDAPILTRVVPSLLQILKVGDGNGDSIGYREAQYQFKFAFRRFIRAVTSFGPVVMTLDDLQWADTASMELLEALISDRETTAFMVIGCYRSDESYSKAPHVQSIENIVQMTKEDTSLAFESISVSNLSVDQVHELLVDLLSSTEAETQALAECIHKKTLGNAFFVVQFITLLVDLNLLEYNMGSMKWSWNVHDIQLSTAATENVVSLMKNKMKRLPASIEQVLPMMACLGSTFSASVFELAFRRCGEIMHDAPVERPSGEPDSKAKEFLALCEQEGLIEDPDEEGELYQWVHDKIQEAAFDLVSEDDLQSLKLELGEILYEEFNAGQLDMNLFVVVNLLNTVCRDITYEPKVAAVELAQLNLRAGVKTIETSAFDQATGYLTKGIELLPSDHWTNQYELSLDLFSTAAEAEFCVGNFEKMRQYCDDIISQEDRPLLDKQRAYNTLLGSTTALHRLSDAAVLSSKILSLLGYRFPKRGIKLRVMAGVLQAKSVLKRQTPEILARLPVMTDPHKMWAMHVLDQCVTVAYLDRSSLFPLLICKGLRWTLDYGISDFSPVMFALVGFILAVFLRDYKGSEAYASHAIEMLKQVRSARKVAARVAFLSHAYVMHWSRPVKMSIKPLLNGYEVGMTIGDTASAARCAYFYMEFCFRTGTPLDILLEECAFYSEQLKQLKQLSSGAILRILWQCIENLTGGSSSTVVLKGSVMDQDQALQLAQSIGNTYFIAAIYRMQMYLAFVFGDDDLVYTLVKKTDMDSGSYEKVIAGNLGLCHLYAFNGLAMVSLYRKTGEKTYLKLAKKFAARVKAWSAAGVRTTAWPPSAVTRSQLTLVVACIESERYALFLLARC